MDHKNSSQEAKRPKHEPDQLTPSRGLLDGSVYYIKIISFCGSAAQRWLWPLRITRFLDHTTHTQPTNIHVPGGIRIHDRSRRAAVDLRLRPRGHWHRHYIKIQNLKPQNVRGRNHSQVTHLYDMIIVRCTRQIRVRGNTLD
jgi:hypothetical protein